MTRHAWAGAAALCFALAGCDHPAESAASTPSADSFRAEVFEVRIGGLSAQSTIDLNEGERRELEISLH